MSTGQTPPEGNDAGHAAEHTTRGKRRTAKVGFPFVAAPLSLDGRWYQCSFYERCIGGEIHRTTLGGWWRCGADWMDALCRLLCVNGTERPQAKRALAKMRERGLIEVRDGQLRVPFAPTIESSGPERGHNEVTSRSERGHNEVTTRSHPGPNEVQTRTDLSDRNYSSHVGQIDRKKERGDREERDRASSPPSMNAETRHELCDVLRFRQPLEDAVRAEFFRLNATPQKANPSQWRDGCQTVQDALDLGTYVDAHEAIAAFASRLVNACGKGEKLGFALQQVPLSGAPKARSSRPIPRPEDPNV